jgi:hypothetical protein
MNWNHNGRMNRLQAKLPQQKLIKQATHRLMRIWAIEPKQLRFYTPSSGTHDGAESNEGDRCSQHEHAEPRANRDRAESNPVGTDESHRFTKTETQENSTEALRTRIGRRRNYWRTLNQMAAAGPRLTDRKRKISLQKEGLAVGAELQEH